MKLKKLLSLKKRNRREPRANDFTVESLEPRLLLSATPMTAAVVVTDHQDYAPGETAVITTSNQAGDGLQFSAGEMVSFQITRTDGMADYSGSTAGVGPTGNEAWYVTDGIGGFTAHLGSDVSGDGVADWIAPDNDLMANSSISTTWYVEEQYRNSTLLVTAAGQESGAVATHAFTDADINTSTVVSVSAATSTYGDDVTFTATVTAAAGSIGPVGTVEFFDAANNSLGATSSPVPGGALESNFTITLSEATLSQLTAGSYVVHAVFTGGVAGPDTYQNSTSGTVNHTVDQKHITGSFGADSRAYDGTTDAFVLFTDLNGHIASDEVALASGVATFADADAAFNKTVTMTGAILFGSDAGNYILDSVADSLADIDKAEAIVTVNGFTGIFDGNPHGATGTATGVLGEDLSGLLDLGPSFTAIGTHVADWTFNFPEVNTNYNPQFGQVDIVINEVTVSTTTTISSSTAATTYGDLVTLTATVTAGIPDAGAPIGTVEFFDGVGNSLGSTSIAIPDIDPLVSIFTLDVTTLIAGNHSEIHAVFTAPATFFGSTSANTTVDVSQASVTVTGFTGIYDGLAHGAIATGVFGEDLSADLLSDSFTNANEPLGQLANWIYTDSTGNYLNDAGTALVLIAKANVQVVEYSGVYDGAAHGATVVGVLGEALMSGPTDTNAGTWLNNFDFIDATGNYNDALAIAATTTILQKEVTASFTANNKEYDGTTDATASGPSLTGVIGLEVVTLDGGIATFDTKDVGINKTVTLTGATLGGADAGNYILSPAAITDQASITALAITGSFTANDKTYDGTTNATVSGTSLNVVLPGDIGLVEMDLTGATATFSDKNVGPGKTVTLTGAILIGSASGNYTLTSVDTATADITALDITGNFTAANKIYDGNAVAGVVTRTLPGAILGDDVSLIGGTAAFDDANAGDGKTVTFTGGTLSGADAGNYNLASVNTTTANIVAKELTGSFTALSKVYDGTTDATVDTTSLTGVLAGDVGLVDMDVTGATASFDDKNVGPGKTVTLTGAILSGTAAVNYSLLSVATTTADITALDITGSFTADSKVYDGFTLAAVSGSSLSVVIGTDDVVLTFDQADFADKNVGTGKTVTLLNAALFGTDAANYNLTSVADALADITALELSFDFTVDDKVYDGGTAATGLIGNLTGFNGADDVDWAFSTVAFNSAIAGPVKLVNLTGLILIGADAGNYSLASSTVQSTAAITQKQLTVTFTVNDKVYDGTTAATGVIVTLDGVIAPDDVNLTGGVAIFDTANAGTGKTVTLTGATLTGTEASNYSLLSVATTTADITALGITGNFTAANKVYDGTTAATVQTRTLSGVLAGDVANVSLTGGTATFADANAGTGKTVTLTGATLAGAASGNYSLTSVNTTTANITALGIVTGNFTVANKVYDSTTAATVQTRTLSGVLAGDVANVSLTGGTATFNNANVGNGKTVTLTGATLAGAAAGNYSLASVNTTTANITALGITGNFTAANKVYNGTTAATVQTRTLSGVLAGDVANVSLTGGTATFNNANVGNGKTVTLTGATLAGAAAGNYSLLSVATTTADITALGITGNFTAANKVYNGTTAATVQTRTLSGVLAGDVANVSLTGGTATFNNANVGNGKTVTLTGATLAGAASGNYSLTSVNTTTANITKANITFTVTGYAVRYDGAAHTATATATGVNGENLIAGVNLSGTTHTNVGTGVYTDTVTYTDTTGNYYNATKLVKNYFSKANITFTVTGYAVRYDGAAHTATATATGVNGEDLSAGVNLSGTTHTNVGTGVYTDTVTYTDTTGNYLNASKLVKNYFSKANITFTVTGYAVHFDGAAHTATATATGVNGENLSAGVNLSGTTHTNVGTYTDTVTYTDTTGNYLNASKLVKNYIV